MTRGNFPDTIEKVVVQMRTDEKKEHALFIAEHGQNILVSGVNILGGSSLAIVEFILQPQQLTEYNLRFL